jgi:hypothetical protein
MLGLIKHTFKHINEEIFCTLYKTLIRPHLEYATPAWSPHLKQDRDKIEKLQRRATKIVPSLKDESYENRLIALKLPTLDYRRLRNDLILIYKITHKLVRLDTDTHCKICKLNTDMLQPSLSTSTRGHNLKYQINHHKGCRHRFLTSRVLNTWNKLRHKTVNSTNINQFKTSLCSDPALPDPTTYKF